MDKKDPDKLTPEQFHKLRMESPDNNLTNCWYALRGIKMDFTKANKLLEIKKK